MVIRAVLIQKNSDVLAVCPKHILILYLLLDITVFRNLACLEGEKQKNFQEQKAFTPFVWYLHAQLERGGCISPSPVLGEIPARSIKIILAF